MYTALTLSLTTFPFSFSSFRPPWRPPPVPLAQSAPDPLLPPRGAPTSISGRDENENGTAAESKVEAAARCHHQLSRNGRGSTASEPSASLDESLGRGSRKRKRKKFFDEGDAEEEEEQQEEAVATPVRKSQRQVPSRQQQRLQQQQQQEQEHQSAEQAADEMEVRRSVFQTSPSSGGPSGRNGGVQHENRQQQQQQRQPLNALFVCQKIPAVSRRRFCAWTPTEVAQLVRTMLPHLGEQVSRRLAEEEVDGEAFLMLTQADLVQSLDLKLGPAVKLFNAISLIRSRLDGGGGSPS